MGGPCPYSWRVPPTVPASELKIIAVFVVMSRIERPGPLLEMAPAFVIFCAVSFSVLLPFLLLSFVNGFYRERLKELLRLADAAPPSARQPHASPEVEGA